MQIAVVMANKWHLFSENNPILYPLSAMCQNTDGTYS